MSSFIDVTLDSEKLTLFNSFEFHLSTKSIHSAVMLPG